MIGGAYSVFMRIHGRLTTGRATGYNKDAHDHDLPFTAKDEVATLPRIQELVIVTKHSPWCTVVRNENGVTLADICGSVWREYVFDSFSALRLVTIVLTSLFV